MCVASGRPGVGGWRKSMLIFVGQWLNKLACGLSVMEPGKLVTCTFSLLLLKQ